MVSSEPQVVYPRVTEPVRTSPTYTPYESVPSARTPDIRASSPPQQTADPRFIQVLPRVPDPGNGRIYRLQVGAFANEINAREAVFRLRELGFDPAYELYGGYCRVIITGVRSGDVTPIIQRLGSAGFEQIFIREEP
ncbi:MAG: SPOR domain-containing protein [Spirochaetaceae bacterium]|nr:SPOR domain-containing protein [Spirochaetaceae bacterium]